MLQIEEWFRRPQRKTERKNVTVMKPVTEQKSDAVFEPDMHHAEPASEKQIQQMTSEAVAEDTNDSLSRINDEKKVVTSMTNKQDENDMFESEEQLQQIPVWKRPEAAQNGVALQDSIAETDELDHISEKIGMDVSGMIDLEKEDFLLQQIDEFREKAKQLQQLMQSRETKAQELQHVVDERKAEASELDSMLEMRRGEADKIMNNVSQKIEDMSIGVRREMSGLSHTVSKEVSGLTQNLTQEINQSSEKTRQMFEAATKNMIDQNTRSLEGLKEQLEQLGQLEQINELSTEMNSQITTLKSDIAEKIHAEDVKCYRNIQASMNEQSKLLTEGDEKTRQHIQEQVDNLSNQMRSQSKISKAILAITILNFLGVAGILAYLLMFL
ncbi:MAG: hypothetical protein J6B28_02350 [Eubacterium sp.]|nr:hypothetical protein [Eubacterium sp.]